MRRRRRNQRAEKISIVFIVLLLLGAMSVQIVRLKNKDDRIVQENNAVQKEIDRETERTEELRALEAKMKTTEYIVELAKSKLGLAFDNEIIFKESGE